MIDNFEALKPFLKNEDEDKFFFLQIIKRRKENLELKTENVIIKTYFIFDFESLLSRKQEIIDLCWTTNSRAYIDLNVRSYKEVSYYILKILSDRLARASEGDPSQVIALYKKNKSLFETACGQKRASGTKKLWVVDLDFKDEVLVNTFQAKISSCRPDDVEKIVAQIPTKNGFHLICRPFDLKQFNDLLTDNEKALEYCVQKNNPCLLYIS